MELILKPLPSWMLFLKGLDRVMCMQACTPFTGNRLGFVSHDLETRFCYISTHHPRHPEVFSIVKQACIRSLSGEVCLMLCILLFVMLSIAAIFSLVLYFDNFTY
jgi:Vesicle coat protein involved in Golgi to plasma membrane transport